MSPPPPRTRRSSAPPAHPRDTEASTFAAILADVVARVAGAYAAVLVDSEGEAVDYAGLDHPFELKLAGAHWQLVLAQLAAFCTQASLGALRTVVIRGARRSFLAQLLPDGYVLVVLLRRRAGFSATHRALSVCERALTREAGWPTPPWSRASAWYAVEVAASTRARRPTRIRIDGVETPVEIVGRVVGTTRRELGYRVRIPSAGEFTLVREPGGRWYADEDIASLRPRDPK